MKKKIAVLHSGITESVRYDQWRQIKRGQINLVIGTRSALFAPIAELKMRPLLQDGQSATIYCVITINDIWPRLPRCGFSGRRRNWDSGNYSRIQRRRERCQIPACWEKAKPALFGKRLCYPFNQSVGKNRNLSWLFLLWFHIDDFDYRHGLSSTRCDNSRWRYFFVWALKKVRTLGVAEPIITTEETIFALENSQVAGMIAEPVHPACRKCHVPHRQWLILSSAKSKKRGTGADHQIDLAGFDLPPLIVADWFRDSLWRTAISFSSNLPAMREISCGVNAISGTR